MATFKQRFTRQNIYALFVACAFPVHVWAIISLLNQVPAWILRVNVWELAGMVGLTLVFAWIESLLVTVGVIVLAALAPRRWVGDKVVILSALFVWLTSIASIFAHLQEPLLRSAWGVLIALIYLGLMVASYWLVHRSPGFEGGVRSLLDRLAILTGFYLFLDAAGLVIVVIRNI